MTEFRKADKVRVSYDAVVASPEPNVFGRVRVRQEDPPGEFYVSPESLELIERVKTSVDDPIGTVRRFKTGNAYSGTIIVRTAQNHGHWSQLGTELDSGLDGWHVYSDTEGNSAVDEYTEIIGYVPGFEPDITSGRVLEDSDGDRWWELSPGKFTFGNDFAEAKDPVGDCYHEQSEPEVTRRHGPVKDVSHLFKDAWK
jgi:hypothetical protein